MVRRPARLAKPSRQKRGKSANSAKAIGAPTKLKIGEAARLIGVETYVLRFWETQFVELRPYHTATKHRLYSDRDMEMLRLIKHLLYQEGFTIEGARKRIKEIIPRRGNAKGAGAPNLIATRDGEKPGRATAVMPSGAARQTLIEIRRDLESLYQLLKD